MKIEQKKYKKFAKNYGKIRKNVVNSVDVIEEPIIVKRDNKQDLVVISLEQYKKELFLAELSSKLGKSEQEYEQGNVHNARTVFKELREKYGY